MANVKITELPQINFSSITNNDVIPIVDVNSNTTSKVLISDLKTFFSTPFTGGTVSGDTIFQNGLTANTISATTYYNLPIDVHVIGGSYSNGTTYFLNNTGGTFSVSGYFTGQTEVLVTGFTYSNNELTISQNSGDTLSVAINDMTGLTINGTLSATTISGGTLYGDGSNLTNLPIPTNSFSYPTISYTNFLITQDAASSNLTAGNFITGPIVEIKNTVTIESLRVRVITPTAIGNNAVLGIYSYTGGSDLNQIITAPSTIVLSVGGVQELTLTTPLSLDAGIYAFVIHPSTNVSMDSLLYNNCQNIFGNQLTMGGTAYRNSIVLSTPYTGTLPTTISVTNITSLSYVTNILAKII